MLRCGIDVFSTGDGQINLEEFVKMVFKYAGQAGSEVRSLCVVVNDEFNHMHCSLSGTF